MLSEYEIILNIIVMIINSITVLKNTNIFLNAVKNDKFLHGFFMTFLRRQICLENHAKTETSKKEFDNFLTKEIF